MTENLYDKVRECYGKKWNKLVFLFKCKHWRWKINDRNISCLLVRVNKFKSWEWTHYCIYWPAVACERVLAEIATTCDDVTNSKKCASNSRLFRELCDDFGSHHIFFLLFILKLKVFLVAKFWPHCFRCLKFAFQ